MGDEISLSWILVGAFCPGTAFGEWETSLSRFQCKTIWSHGLSQANQSIFTKATITAMADQSSNDDLDSIATQSSHNYASDDNFSDSSMSTKLSASDARFPIELGNARITTCDPAPPVQRPVGFLDICQYLNQDRDSTPTPAQELVYRNSIYRVGNEDEMMQIILPQLIDTTYYFCHEVFSMVFNRPWLFQHIFSERLGHPQPDVTCGLTYRCISALFPNIFNLQEDFCRNLLPLKGTVLPTLFIEAKGPKGILSEAGLQNQHNGACALKNILAVKLALKAKPEDYIRRIQALGIKITSETVQATCYWIDDKLQYLSADLLDPISLYDLAAAQKLFRNVVDWTRLVRQVDLLKDLESLEKLTLTLTLPDRKRDAPDSGEIASSARKKRRLD